VKFDWKRINLGDIHYALLRLRAASLPDGHLYAFQVKCESCGEPYPWELDIINDLRVQALPESSAEIIRTGGRHEATAAGRRVEFELRRLSQIGTIRKEMKRMQRRGMSLAESVAMQVAHVDGLKSQDMRSIYRFVLDLDWDEVLSLRDQFDEADGMVLLDGVDTKCIHCKWQQEITLPFGKTFFRPPKRKATTEKMSEDDSDQTALHSVSEPSSETSPRCGGAMPVSNSPGAAGVPVAA
jgi:hypothetical protein